jgi:hypothetical protein
MVATDGYNIKVDPISARALRFMNIDTKKIDESVLTLLYLTLHDRSRHGKDLMQKS